MKKLVLSEGTTDTTFLKKLIENYHNHWDLDVYDIESQRSDSRIPLESEKIRNFKQRWCSDDVLLKSEGGKTNLLDVIPVVIRRESTTKIDFDFLIDLDNDRVDDFIEHINASLAGRSAGRDVRVCAADRTNRTYLTTQRLEFLSEDNFITDFHITCLDPSLEEIGSISNGDSDEVVSHKLDQLVDTAGIREPLLDILFDR